MSSTMRYPDWSIAVCVEKTKAGTLVIGNKYRIKTDSSAPHYVWFEGITDPKERGSCYESRFRPYYDTIEGKYNATITN